MMHNLIYLVICLFVLFTSFDRVRKTGADTRWEIRWSIASLGAAALWAGLSSLEGKTPVTVQQTALIIAIAVLQWVTGRLWKEGPPEHFRKP